MVYQSRPRKRVHAIRRAPDGSAFQICESCGISVAIALADMHECELKKTEEKLKAQLDNWNVKRQMIQFQDQPRSAFRFFAEELMKTCEDENEVEIDRKAFETWKNMSKEDRQPFIFQADRLNSAYVKRLHEEETLTPWFEDEADSAEVGIYDESYEESEMYYFESGSSDGSGFFLSESYETFDTKVLLQACPWATKKGS